MAPAASYDFHVDGQAAIAAKRAFSPSLLSLSLTATRRGTSIARSAIIQASLAKGFSLRGTLPLPPLSPSLTRSLCLRLRSGKEERARVFVHVVYTCELVHISSPHDGEHTPIHTGCS